MKNRSIYMSLLFLVVTTIFCYAENTGSISPILPSPAAGYHPYGHAHNDVQHKRPLLDALDNRFYSVEADIWTDKDGNIMVSHDPGKSGRSFKELYLDPLQNRVNQKGSVFGDNEPFYLWLDLKEGTPVLLKALQDTLNQYSMLTAFTEEKIIPGAVTIILTGDDKGKTAFVNENPERKACRDSNFYTPEDPKADNRWRYYALNWSNYIKWNGSGTIPATEYKKLIELLKDAHQKGRKVRFWANPDTPAYWELALKNGIDLINTDQLKDLNQYLEQYK